MGTLQKLAILSISAVVSAAGLACGSADPVKGEKGDPGAPGTSGGDGTTQGTDPSAGLVVPNVGLLDRETDVQLDVEGLKVDQPPTLDFGDGVKVSNVTIVSPTTVSAHLAIASSAKIGDRDVKISAGGKDLLGQKAFHVLPPLDVKVIAGKAEQAGMMVLDVKNRDTQAFDPQNFALVGDGMIAFSTVAVTSTNATMLMLLEPSAATGPSLLEGQNGDPPLQTFLSDPAAVNVAARTPVALTAPLTGEKIGARLETKLYKVTIPAGTTPTIGAINLKVAADSKLSPMLIVLPSSGKFESLLTILQPPSGGFFAPPPEPPFNLSASLPMLAAAQATDVTLMLIDANADGGSDFTFDLSFNPIAGTLTAEKATAHATAATPQVLTVPTTGGLVIDGEYGTADTLDVYKINVAANSKIEVAFSPQYEGSFALTNNTLTFDPDNGAKAVLEPYAGAADTSRVTLATAGDYYLVVKSADQAKTKNGKYSFSVRKY